MLYCDFLTKLHVESKCDANPSAFVQQAYNLLPYPAGAGDHGHGVYDQNQQYPAPEVYQPNQKPMPLPPPAVSNAFTLGSRHGVMSF